jgi:hypothetical protein
VVYRSPGTSESAGSGATLSITATVTFLRAIVGVVVDEPGRNSLAKP